MAPRAKLLVGRHLGKRKARLGKGLRRPPKALSISTGVKMPRACLWTPRGRQSPHEAAKFISHVLHLPQLQGASEAIRGHDPQQGGH